MNIDECAIRDAIIKKVEERVEKELEAKGVNPGISGYIEAFEKRKKEILQGEFGIPYETQFERDRTCSVD